MKLHLAIEIITLLIWVSVNCVTGAPAAVACGNRPLATSGFGSRVVGGTDALPGTWPWLVSMQQPWDENSYIHLCGGSILNVQWVLTAAHCFKEQSNDIYSWRLVFGANQLSNLGSTTQSRRILKKIEHKHYNPETEHNDIALLLLDKPISYNDHIQPACLPGKTSDVSRMTDCYISGWGVLEEESTEPSDTLQEARVLLIPNTRCNSTRFYNGVVGVYNLCAGYESGGVDSCQGDSGGPLMCKEPKAKIFSVVGVTSWGSGCAQATSPGIYTSTQFYHKWIIDNLIPVPSNNESKARSMKSAKYRDKPYNYSTFRGRNKRHSRRRGRLGGIQQSPL